MIGKQQLQCRAAVEKDYHVISGFIQNKEELFYMFPSIEFPLLPEKLKYSMTTRSDPTVVEMHGEVVAFANFYKWEQNVACSIGNVIVSPGARGCGVGKLLIEHMTKIAWKKYNAKAINISCFNENIAGLLLYFKLGFKPYSIEERLDYEQNRVALIHMKLVQHS